MIERSRRAHHGRNRQRIVDHIGPLLARADGHDHALRRVDHRFELFDPHHPHVGEAGRPALIFVRLEFAVLRLGGKRGHFGGNCRDRLVAGIDDDRGDEPIGNADRNRDVGPRIFEHRITRERDIAFGHHHQCEAERLDQHVVDREFHAPAFKAGIEFAAQLQKRVEADIHRQIDMRHLLLGFGQAAGNRLAHTREFYDFVRDAEIGDRGESGCHWRRSRCSHGLRSP